MKSAARLTSSLLARKGYAAPCDIRSSHAATTHFPSAPAPSEKVHSETFLKEASPPDTAKHIFTPPPGITNPGTTAKEMAQRGIKPQKPNNCPQECDNGPENTGRVAMTLRLDAARHKRLRLVSVHSQRSARDIITAALDSYLDKIEPGLDVDNCHCLQQSKP